MQFSNISNYILRAFPLLPTEPKVLFYIPPNHVSVQMWAHMWLCLGGENARPSPGFEVCLKPATSWVPGPPQWLQRMWCWQCNASGKEEELFQDSPSHTHTTPNSPASPSLRPWDWRPRVLTLLSSVQQSLKCASRWLAPMMSSHLFCVSEYMTKERPPCV